MASEELNGRAAYKDALLRKRDGNSRRPAASSRCRPRWRTTRRQGDLADQASGNNEVHIQLKLKQTDAKILQAIEEALERIEKGTYGVCRDCGEPIAPARLNAIPWTRVCITCKEKQSVVTAPSCSACCRSSTATSATWCSATRRARVVGSTSFNNTYQYVINREDAHLQLARASASTTLAGGCRRTSPAPRPDAGTGGAGAAGDRWRRDADGGSGVRRRAGADGTTR